MITCKDIHLEKMRRFCLYQERCQSEVRSKLIALKIYGNDLEEIIVALIEEQFIDEERYAKKYALSKFNQKKWGKIKIKQYLKFKQISDYCIRKAILEISDSKYWEQLTNLLAKKIELEGGVKNKNKIYRFLILKGYEYQLVNTAFNSLL